MKRLTATLCLLWVLLWAAWASAATAVVVPAGVHSDGTNATMNYTVVLINAPNPPIDFSSDYTINPAITLTQNITAWKNKIIGDAAGFGVTITTANIILWGAP